MLEKISDQFSNIFRTLSGVRVITEKNIADAVEEIKIALLEADVNLRIVRRFINSTIEEAKGESVLKSVNPGQQFTKIVYDKLTALLGDKRAELDLKGPDTVSVILMAGLQGSGKTTTAAKLAYRLRLKGRRVLLAAADLARPAAIEQLRVMGERAGVEVYAEDGEKDAVKVAKNAFAVAKKRQFDTLIVDTAGRIHLDEALMNELAAVKKSLAPTETLFVADAMTGQQAVEIAKEFEEKIGLTGVVLTKFDSDARGGAAISLKTVTGKPLKFIGTGEKIENLEEFFPDRMASRILGMGDIVSLVEKAQEAVDQKEAEELEAKMAKSAFTLEDYLEQFQRIKKMGSVKNLLQMLPGAAGKIDEDKVDLTEMKREEAMILSMTVQERRNHRIIGPSRKKRIALGSGTTVYDVNRLLNKFDKMRLMMKKVAKNKKYRENLLSQFEGRQ